MKMKSALYALTIVVMTAFRAEASTYDLTITSAAYDVAAQITTDGNQVIAISGSVTGLLTASITGLDGQPNALYTSDNLVFSAQPYVTNLGVLFDAGGFVFNVYSVGNGSLFDYYISSNQFGADFFANPLYNPGSLIIEATAIATPLPSSLLMLAPVLAAMLGFTFHRARRGGGERPHAV